MIRILTDSASDLTATDSARPGVYTVPLSVTFADGTGGLDGVELTADEFYAHLKVDKVPPRTSQPSPQSFMTIFEDAKENGDQVIAILISSNLSGTYQCARLAAESCDFEDVFFVDSRTASQGEGINIAYEPVKIDFPFEVEDVESVEMYHYDGVPASAEKKVVVAENDIKTLYDKFKGLSLKDKTTEETAGADVTSFRFNLSDGTSYDLIYACYGVKNGELKSEAGGFKYFTSADIGSYWNNLNTELEAIPINESELP